MAVFVVYIIYYEADMSRPGAGKLLPQNFSADPVNDQNGGLTI